LSITGALGLCSDHFVPNVLLLKDRVSFTSTARQGDLAGGLLGMSAGNIGGHQVLIAKLYPVLATVNLIRTHDARLPSRTRKPNLGISSSHSKWSDLRAAALLICAILRSVSFILSPRKKQLVRHCCLLSLGGDSGSFAPGRGRVIEADQTNCESGKLQSSGGRREVRDDTMPIPEYFAASALIVLITLAVAALVKGF
jgi:hypothetical protein